MIDDLDEYLQDGSPFLREVNLSTLDPIISNLFLEQDYSVIQALAKWIFAGEATSVWGAIGKNPGKYLPTTQEQVFRDMAEYSKGFLRPFRLLQLALLARRTGLEQAKEIHSWRSAKNADWHFEHENLPFAFTLLRADPSGVRFINRFVQKEVAASTNLYYKVGSEAARRIYCSYTDIFATLIPDSEGEDEEDSTPLLPHLDKREEPAPPLQSIQQVAPPIPLAEEFFVKLAAEEEPYPPYPGKSFLQDIQRIRALKERLADGEDVSTQLFEEWERLAEQRGLEQYSALWTMVCIAFGDFSLQQFRQTGQERFIKAARWAYAKPLEKSSVWKADLGTRYLCATRLGKLYSEYEKSLKMPTIQIAQALHDIYLDMLRVNERLYQRSPYQESKRKLQARNDFMMARALEACVYLSLHSEEAESVQWRREAFIIAESGKSRMLREEMALAERLPPTEMPARLCEAEKACLDGLRNLYTKIATRKPTEPLEPSSFDEFNTERNKLRLDLEQVWAEMEDHGDEARAYVIARRDEALQWEGLQWGSFQRVAERLGENFALVSISMLPESVLFAVLRSGRDAPELCRVSLSQNDLQSRYLDSYEEEILNRNPFQKKDFLRHEWQNLGDKLFAPLVSLLYGVKYVYFLPNGVFHNLPLHALTIDGEPFIKHWGVAYAPSISVLESTLSRPKSQGAALVMGYADPNNPGDMAREFMLEEAKKIATFFHSSHVLPEKVNAQLLREEGQSARLIHLACHGVFAEEDPLNSGVMLTNGIFTARHWLQLRLQADLVTLSACQVGISGIRPGDDLVGLTRSILFAGASSLLMSLWSVNSIATRDWMLLFYQNLQKNDDLARKIDAFQNATLALLERYNDPYYWAPFVLVGHP